jgi:DNA invertase Pin-like site-specific DNA recombinase
MKLKQKSKISEQSKIILEQRKLGKSIDELARGFNISRSRVYRILQDYGDTLPKKLSTDA